jgi:hypothetical protein
MVDVEATPPVLGRNFAAVKQLHQTAQDETLAPGGVLGIIAQDWADGAEGCDRDLGLDERAGRWMPPNDRLSLLGAMSRRLGPE